MIYCMPQRYMVMPSRVQWSFRDNFLRQNLRDFKFSVHLQHHWGLEKIGYFQAAFKLQLPKHVYFQKDSAVDN